MQLKLSPTEIEKLVTAGFESELPLFHVEELRPGYLRMRSPFERRMLRPGNTIAGPALFAAADVAMYALVLAHIGPEMMAVTAQLSINFLNKGRPADILSEATMLKLGRKLAVMEVRLSCDGDPTPVAHVTGSYSIPKPRA
jgi:uncharacterized protein (TIGR00369 family)